ncbi:hypothetical protein AEGHOMDF_5377 [Methylobacterium soli]|nr:hypothetical protein AEGHOMDF_5377 [Methylobacterium soli]
MKPTALYPAFSTPSGTENSTTFTAPGAWIRVHPTRVPLTLPVSSDDSGATEMADR